MVGTDRNEPTWSILPCADPSWRQKLHQGLTRSPDRRHQDASRNTKTENPVGCGSDRGLLPDHSSWSHGAILVRNLNIFAVILCLPRYVTCTVSH